MNYLEWLWGKGARRDSGGKFFLEYDSPFRSENTQFYNGQPIEWDAKSGTFLNLGAYDSPNTLNWSSDFNPDIIDFGDFSVDINSLLDPNNFAGSDFALEQRGIVFQSGGGNLEVTPDSKNRVREFFSGVGSGLWNDIKEFAKNAGPDLAKYLLAKAITGYLTKDDNDAINEFRDILKKDNDRVREENRIARERREAITSRLQDRILKRLDSESTPYDNIPVPQRLPSFNPNIQRFNTRDGQGGHVGSLADATMYRYAPSFLAPQDPNVDPFSTESIRDFSGRATSPWASGQPWNSAKPWENDPNFVPTPRAKPTTNPTTNRTMENPTNNPNYGKDRYSSTADDDRVPVGRGWVERFVSSKPPEKLEGYGWIDSDGNKRDYSGEYNDFINARAVGTALHSSSEPPEMKSGDDLTRIWRDRPDQPKYNFPNSGSVGEQIAKREDLKNQQRLSEIERLGYYFDDEGEKRYPTSVGSLHSEDDWAKMTDEEKDITIRDDGSGKSRAVPRPRRR